MNLFDGAKVNDFSTWEIDSEYATRISATKMGWAMNIIVYTKKYIIFSFLRIVCIYYIAYCVCL